MDVTGDIDEDEICLALHANFRQAVEMQRIDCLFSLVVWASAIFLAVPLRLSAAPPNVVVILSDDQGWGDLSANGNTNLATPHIDSLAKDGARFDRFYVCPVCSPTRAEFLTGRYHPRGGVTSTSTGGERLDLDETTLAEVLRAAGYATGAFGKWHNGSQGPYHPNARGFDTFYGFTSGHWGDYFSPPLDHNGEPVTGNGYLPDDLTDRALAFIATNRDRPFFCYVPYNTPHSPMQVPDKEYQKFERAQLPLRARDGDREDLDFTRAALAMCENQDANVGRILATLEDLGLAENTIVIWFSDNGPNRHRWNGGMKGIKSSIDEGGVRSPFFIRWKNRIPAGKVVPEIAGAIDLLPTLVSLTGIAFSPPQPLDGVSLQPLLAASPVSEWPERMIFSHWAGKVSVRTPQYRLDPDGRLFDMIADPGQLKDIATSKPQIAANLSNAVDQWKKELLPGLKSEKQAFPIGWEGLPLTVLPARDGVGHGEVVRSASAPNCSYFRNWTQARDRITWDTEVLQPGRYQVAVLYACPAADLGSEVEFSLLGKTLRATVAVPNDPPLLGAENDRVKRNGESYVKDFQPMDFGVIDLPAGRGRLTLRATQIPGRQVMEVRELHLRRLGP